MRGRSMWRPAVSLCQHKSLAFRLYADRSERTSYFGSLISVLDLRGILQGFWIDLSDFSLHTISLSSFCLIFNLMIHGFFIESGAFWMVSSCVPWSLLELYWSGGSKRTILENLQPIIIYFLTGTTHMLSPIISINSLTIWSWTRKSRIPGLTAMLRRDAAADRYSRSKSSPLWRCTSLRGAGTYLNKVHENNHYWTQNHST